MLMRVIMLLSGLIFAGTALEDVVTAEENIFKTVEVVPKEPLNEEEIRLLEQKYNLIIEGITLEVPEGLRGEGELTCGKGSEQTLTETLKQCKQFLVGAISAENEKLSKSEVVSSPEKPDPLLLSFQGGAIRVKKFLVQIDPLLINSLSKDNSIQSFRIQD